jgi:YebC/PmpR family DNA-binding regulatory protein
MSGHSKWATIRHKKGAQDAKRGKLFTKIIKEITVAARMGGGDEESNASLRAAILKARSANMPKDNITRAIKKGTGDLEGESYSELTYEGYGPGGVALLIQTLTDNKNRTAADLRSLLTKSGGNMGEAGCVSYMFQRKGIITFDMANYSEDQIFEAALDAGAEDVSVQGDTIEVITAPEDFSQVLDSLQAHNLEQTVAEITMIPDSTISLERDKMRKTLELIEKIDDHDDVQSVASNLDIPDDFEFEEE